MSALPEQVTQEAAAPTKYMQREDLFKIMRALGVVRLEVFFDGGGKSSDTSIEKIDGLVEDPEKIPMAGVEAAVKKTDTEEFYKRVSRSHRELTLETFLLDCAEDILAASDWGFAWYREEGSYGTVTIVPEEDTIDIDINVREITSTNHGQKL